MATATISATAGNNTYSITEGIARTKPYYITWDGLGGTDQLNIVYTSSFNKSKFSLYKDSSGIHVDSISGASHQLYFTLNNVEKVRFNDQTVDLTILFPGNSPPSGSVTITGTALLGEMLTASNSLTDTNGIPATGAGAIQYQWLADGIDIIGATAGSLTLTQAEVGKKISVKASYTDNGGTSEMMVSAQTIAVGAVRTTEMHDLTVLVDKNIIDPLPVLLKGLIETMVITDGIVTTHNIEYAGIQFSYNDVDALITTVIRDGVFTEEYRREIADAYPSVAGITYQEAVGLVGIANIDQIMIDVAGIDGNYVG